jgi:hypothetical protein
MFHDGSRHRKMIKRYSAGWAFRALVKGARLKKNRVAGCALRVTGCGFSERRRVAAEFGERRRKPRFMQARSDCIRKLEN